MLGLGVRAGPGWGIRELYWVLKMFYTLTVVLLDTPHVKLINMYTLNECIDLYVNYTSIVYFKENQRNANQICNEIPSYTHQGD